MSLFVFGAAHAQSQPNWLSQGMEGHDQFNVTLDQGNGVRLRASVGCTSTRVEQIWFHLEGIGSRQAADFLPAEVNYFSDAGRRNFRMNAFLSSNRISLSSTNAALNYAIARDMINSSTLDFDFTIYNVNWGKGLYVVPTRNLRQAMAKEPNCRKVLGLSPAASQSITPAASPKSGAALYTTANLNLRRAPSTSAAKITELKANTFVRVLENCSGGWCRVLAQGQTGYVSQKYLR